MDGESSEAMILKKSFERAYYDWVKAIPWQLREVKWLEYCAIRDTYLGHNFDHFKWQKIDSSEYE